MSAEPKRPEWLHWSGGVVRDVSNWPAVLALGAGVCALAAFFALG